MNSKVKNLSIYYLTGYFILFTIYIIGVIYFVYDQGYLESLIHSIESKTYGLIQATFLTYIGASIIFIVGFLFMFKKIKQSEVGLIFNKLKQATVLFISLVILIQIISILYNLIVYRDIVLDDIWIKNEVGMALGAMIAQLFGVAFVEEVIFRGLLISQVGNKVKAKNKASHFIKTIVISQFIFSIWHIPIRLYNEYSISELIVSLLVVFLLGLLFSIIYMLTNNIFIAMFYHAMINITMTVVQADLYIPLLFLSIVAVCLLWNKKIMQPILNLDK